MPDLHALTVLLTQNIRQRDAAIAEHLRAQAASRAAAAQAEQLRSYRHEYAQRWRVLFAVKGQIEVVHCYQVFMDRLTQAVEHQACVEANADRQVTHSLAVLTAAELRCASVRKLIERRTHEHRIAADRRDQKQSDEFAARAAWNRRSADGQPRLA
jgi:flagellar protein FliJ